MARPRKPKTKLTRARIESLRKSKLMAKCKGMTMVDYNSYMVNQMWRQRGKKR